MIIRKFSNASFITARIAPIMCSQCSRFHPNRFTFGGLIAERVNTLFAS